MNDAEKLAALEDAWNMLHWGCDNPDHREAYLEMARILGYDV